MANILNSIRHAFSTVRPIPAGMYHYQAPADDPRNYRLHLRIEPDASGVLIVNAATVLHLNQTAAEYAYYIIENRPVEQVAQQMADRYHVSPEQARQDYQDLIGRIQALVNSPDLDPVTYLDFDRKTPFTGHISAPYRLDCAITYSLETASPGAAPEDRVQRELSTAEWEKIFDKAWEAGIPHIVFTGGEPTLRQDLPGLIAHAQANGQVTGLITGGLRLVEKAYLDQLLQTGLDHLMLVFRSENEASWKALENALAEDLFVAVHLTVTEHNQGELTGLLERLAGMGVPAISLSASDPSLGAALQEARDQVARLDLELVWNLPVPYSALHPVALELADEKPEGAGKAWLYVEPDGDVLPAQGIKTVLGNFLTDPWEKIWKK